MQNIDKNRSLGVTGWQCLLEYLKTSFQNVDSLRHVLTRCDVEKEWLRAPENYDGFHH